MVRVGNAQGFWGDRGLAPLELLTASPGLDFLTLDYLAEASLSIMAVQREKDPKKGFAADFLDVVKTLVPLWKKGMKTRIVTNAGGLNPRGCGEAVLALLEGLPLKVGIVTGDAVSVPGASTANAYLGAKPIADLLTQGADIVITGRVADPSLTVGPCMHHYKWQKDYDALAGATVAGHLIECGAQVTGGFSTNWLEVPHPETIGYPIAEVYGDGSCTITKAPGTGGKVTLETVKEQLLYEIGDPSAYLSPDVTVSFLTLRVTDLGSDRVKVEGATGQAPPDTLKVSCSYKEGYRVEAFLFIAGRDSREKLKRASDVLFSRVAARGYTLAKTCVEYLGDGVLRIAAFDPSQEPLNYLAQEIAPLITNGPQGLYGYMGGRPKVRPVYGFKPSFVPVSTVHPEIEIL